MKRNKLMKVLLLALSIAALLSVGCFAAEVGESFAYNTLWAALPPIIAIGLALITKEVYSSLFCGIAGAVFHADVQLLRQQLRVSGVDVPKYFPALQKTAPLAMQMQRQRCFIKEKRKT